MLQRSRVRELESAFVMEGDKLLSAAFDAGAEIESVFVASDAAASESGRVLLKRASDAGVRVFELAPGVVERVSDTVTPQPFLGIVRTPRPSFEDLVDPTFVVVCVDVRDPGNAGAVIRVADAAGADAVISCEGTVDPFNPKTVRASAGSVLNLPVISAGRPGEVLEDMARRGLASVAAVAHGGSPHTEVDFRRPVALVLGNESSGIPEAVSTAADELVSVAMEGGAESLNVSMAAAVLCFEVARQRSNLQRDGARKERKEG